MSDNFTPFFNDEPERFQSSDYCSQSMENVETLAEDEKMVEQETELSLLREQARQQGYAEGLKQAADETMQQQEELLKWLRWIHHPVELIDAQLSEEIVKTIVWICEESIGIELSVKPEQIQNLLDKIKEFLPSVSGEHTIMMHPEDIKTLHQLLDKSEHDSLSAILAEDEKLKRGDFYFKSEQIELDGQLKTRIRQILSEAMSANSENE